MEQREIEHLIGLENHIMQLQRIYNEAAADVMDRILNGALVESGTHTAGVRHSNRGRVRTVRLVIR